jgi:hypothetical protein
MRGGRSRAERDAVTVEIVYAAASGALLAAAGFAATASPVLADAAHGAARKAWLAAAVVVATALFCLRVALTLRRFERLNRLRGSADRPAAHPRLPRQRRPADEDDGPEPDQPSQPGRTNPDS